MLGHFSKEKKSKLPPKSEYIPVFLLTFRKELKETLRKQRTFSDLSENPFPADSVLWMSIPKGILTVMW